MKKLLMILAGATLQTLKVNVHLNPSFNTISLTNPYFWAPDIDKFTLKKIN